MSPLNPNSNILATSDLSPLKAPYPTASAPRMHGIEVITLAKMKHVMARHRGLLARCLSLLPPETQCGAQQLIQVATTKVFTPGLPPCEYARQVTTFDDQAEAERHAGVNDDIRLLGGMAEDIYERLENYQVDL